MSEALTLYFDGAAWPNPGGTATYGWALCGEVGEFIARGSGVAKEGAGATNNVSEFFGLGMGLKYVLANQKTARQLVIRGDSQLVIKQVLGQWRCNVQHLAVLRDRCRAQIEALKSGGWDIRLEWVPREQNGAADGLSVAAWERATGRTFPDLAAMKARRK
jgi:ribonuclease HI